MLRGSVKEFAFNPTDYGKPVWVYKQGRDRLVLQQMMLKETFPFGLLSLYLNTYVEKVTHVKQAGSWGPMGVRGQEPAPFPHSTTSHREHGRDVGPIVFHVCSLLYVKMYCEILISYILQAKRPRRKH